MRTASLLNKISPFRKCHEDPLRRRFGHGAFEVRGDVDGAERTIHLVSKRGEFY